MNAAWIRFLFQLAGYIVASAIPVEVIAGGEIELSSKSQYLIAGMRAEREKIRSGHVLILGDRRDVGGYAIDFQVPVRFEIMFDLDKQLFRFDQVDHTCTRAEGNSAESLRKWEARTDLPRGTGKDGKPWITIESGGSLVRTPSRDLFFPINGSAIESLPAGTVRNTSITEFDVRAMGLMPGVAFSRGESVEKILTNLSHRPFETVHTSEDSMSRCGYQTSTWNSEIWIDEAHGMTPIRFIVLDRKLKEKNSASCQVDWKKIGDIWVPVTCGLEEIRSEVTQSYHLTLDWKSINQPLDPHIFQPAGLIRGENVVVADTRLGKPVFEPAVSLPIPIAKPVNPNSSSRWRWIILANVIGGGMVWWFFRRRAKSQAP